MNSNQNPLTPHTNTVAQDDDNKKIDDQEPPRLSFTQHTSIGGLSPTSADPSLMSSQSDKHAVWHVKEQRELIARDPWLRLYEQTVILPNGQEVDNYHYLRLPDHVVIYARTSDNMVATLRQYKHGLGAVTSVLPSGMIKEGENSYFTAQRELRRETGLASERWYLLGKFRVNSNLGAGDGYYYLADCCYFVDKSESDDLKEAELEWLNAKYLRHQLHAGEQPLMHQALAIALVRSFESDP